MASKTLGTIAAIFMVAGSTAAAAQSTAAPAPATARAAAQTQDSNEFAGTMEWVLAAIALGILIFGIIHFTDDQRNSHSP